MKNIILAILGAFIGSFMLCVTEGGTIFRRSHCDHCKRNLKPYELIPILSYLCFRQCRTCKNNIPFRHFFNEILFFLIFFSFSFHSSPPQTLLLILMSILIPLSIYDTIHFKIPSHMLMILFLLLLINYQFSILQLSIGILVTFLLHAFYFITKSIGYGDIKLLSIFALLLPPELFVLIFLLTYVLGGLATIIFLFYKNQMTKLPLVPFITASSWIVVTHYNELYSIYFGGFQ